MINSADCVHETLNDGEQYRCHECREVIWDDFYAIMQGVVAEGKKIGVRKFMNGLPTPTARRRFYMILYHPSCFKSVAGTTFMFNITETKK